MDINLFKNYINESEPVKRDKGYALAYCNRFASS